MGSVYAGCKGGLWVISFCPAPILHPPHPPILFEAEFQPHCWLKLNGRMSAGWVILAAKWASWCYAPRWSWLFWGGNPARRDSWVLGLYMIKHSFLLASKWPLEKWGCFYFSFSFSVSFFIFQKKHLCGEKMLHYLLLREKESDSLARFRDRKITLSSEYSKELK